MVRSKHSRNSAQRQILAVIALGGNTSVSSNGSLTGTSYTVTTNPGTGATSTENNVGDALSDLNTAVNQSLTFTGDNGSTERKLGQELTVTGGVTDTDSLTANNIGVVADEGSLSVELAKDLDLTDAGSITIGDTNITNDGLTIGTGDSQVAVTVNGISAGGNKITNVAAGTDDTDAVNVGQLKDTNQDITDLANTPITFKGDSGDNVDRKLGETLSITGGASSDSLTSGNIGVVGDSENGLSIELAKDVDLGADGSLSIGTTTLTQDSLEIGDTNITNDGLTIGTGDSQVSVTSNGISAGGNKITNVAAGTDDTDAVNVGQLNDKIGEVTDTPITFSGDSGSDVARNLGDTLNIKGGASSDSLTTGNIGVVGDGTDTLEIELSKDIELGNDGSIAIGETTLDNDGFINGDTTIDGTGLMITDGPSVTTSGINAGDMKITHIANGDISSDSADAINGSQLYDFSENIASVLGGVSVNADGTINNPTFNIGGETYNSFADAIDELSKGWNISTDSGDSDSASSGDSSSSSSSNGTSTTVYPGDTVTIAAGNNISVSQDDKTITISTSDNPTFDSVTANTVTTNTITANTVTANTVTANTVTANTVTANTVTVGDTTINNDGITNGDTTINSTGIHITSSSNSNNEVSLTGDGLDNAGNTIKNVGAGVNGTDAVNVNQLTQTANQINSNINKVDKRARSGIASAMASAGLPQAYMPGKSMVSAAGGSYRGQNALAVGISTISDSGKWVLKGTANVNDKDTGVSVGVGYQW